MKSVYNVHVKVTLLNLETIFVKFLHIVVLNDQF